MSKLQGQLEEERQRDKKEFERQKKAWEKDKKDHEATLIQKINLKEREKLSLKDLTQQLKDKLQEKDKECEKFKQKCSEIGLKKDKLEIQLVKE